MTGPGDEPGDPQEGGPADEERRRREEAERARRRREEEAAEEAEALEAVAHVPEAEALEAVEIIAGEDDTRLRRLTAIGIVVVSILAAVMVWRASVADESGAAAAQSAQQNQIQRQELLSSDETSVFRDVRLFGRYEEHSDLAAALERQAARSPTGTARSLLVQAQRERGLARQEHALFGDVAPDRLRDGTVTYDAAYAREQQRLRDTGVEDLRPPAELRAQAAADHLRGVRLTGLAALFVAALVFLTLAEINRREIGRWFATAGAAVAVAALVLFALVI